MKINSYLDDAKQKTGSDYATAKALGVTHTCIYNMRRGQISNENARKLAELLEVSPLEIIAAGEIAKHPERREAWAKWVKVACILIAIGAGNQVENQELSAKSTGDNLYIMRTLRGLSQSSRPLSQRV